MTTSETPYRLEANNRCTIVALLPALNNVQWAEIEQIGSDALAQLEKSRTPVLLVDLSELEYMGSAMVALIVRLWKAVQKHGGRMVVVNRHPLVFEVLKLAGLHTVWTIVESRDDAFKQLGIRSAGAGDGGAGGVLLGILAVIGAIAGLLLRLSPENLIDDKAALALELGSSAFGLMVGAVLAARHAGLRRGFGVFVIVACVVVIAVGVAKRPDSFAPHAQPKAPEEPKDKAGGKAKGSAKPVIGIKGEPKTTPQAKPAAKPTTPAKPQPATKPKAIVKPASKKTPATKPKPETKPVTKPDPPAKPKSTPKPTPPVKPNTKPKPTPAKPNPPAKPKPLAKPKPPAKPEVKPTTKPIAPATAKPKANRPLKNGGQTNKTVSRSSEAAPLAVRLMEGVILKLIVSMRFS